MLLVQIGVLTTCCAIELALIIISKRGTIINEEPRQPIGNLLTARYGIAVFEVFWVILSMFWTGFCFEHCDNIGVRIVIIGKIPSLSF